MEPEAALLGCVMQLGAGRALGLLQQLTEEDFPSPIHREVLRLMKGAVGAGRPAEPRVLYADAVSAGRPPGGQKITQLTQCLAQLFDNAPAPFMADYFLEQVLQRAWRRRAEIATVRIRQGLEECGDASLLDLVAREFGAVLSMHGRLACMVEVTA